MRTDIPSPIFLRVGLIVLVGAALLGYRYPAAIGVFVLGQIAFLAYVFATGQ